MGWKYPPCSEDQTSDPLRLLTGRRRHTHMADATLLSSKSTVLDVNHIQTHLHGVTGKYYGKYRKPKEIKHKLYVFVPHTHTNSAASTFTHWGTSTAPKKSNLTEISINVWLCILRLVAQTNWHISLATTPTLAQKQSQIIPSRFKFTPKSIGFVMKAII